MFLHCFYFFYSFDCCCPEPLYIDDLEDILDQGMLSLNVEVEDGSVEEVSIFFLNLLASNCCINDYLLLNTANNFSNKYIHG